LLLVRTEVQRLW